MTHPASQHRRPDPSRSSVTRRTLLAGAAAVGGTIALGGSLSAQEATPETIIGGRPAVGIAEQTRGAGGELRIIQWQAPSHLSALQAIGEKDQLAASLVSEPLMVRGPQGQLIANLITQVPTVENGLLAEDTASVSFDLLEGVTWSDGEPFTADDVIFTLDWILDKTVSDGDSNAAVDKAIYQRIASYTAEGSHRVTVTYAEDNPTWSEGFTGAGTHVIYPKHVLDGGGAEALNAFRRSPIGTGPYVVESFTENNILTYVANERYREPTNPYFSPVVLTGGGTAGDAARAVIQHGEYDFAWNLAIDPERADSLVREDGPGVLLVTPGLGIETVYFNFSDPRVEVNGQRSEMNTPHPILSDLTVRQAIAYAIDRDLIVTALFFGERAESPAVNVLEGFPSLEAKGNKLSYEPTAAEKLLDDAGWLLDGEVRLKDGVELALTLQTSTNLVRQKIQQVIKQQLETVGFRIDLSDVDPMIYFSNTPGSDDGVTHFFTDMAMFTVSVGSAPPVAYMRRWYAGEDGAGIAQLENTWTAANIQRYQNPDYDELFELVLTESDADNQQDLFVGLNDLLLLDAVVLPLVRVRNRMALARTLNQQNVAPNPYEVDYWNIANWNRVP